MNSKPNDSQKIAHGPLVVGVGASAGGLEAFQGLLKALGDSPGIAIVFVQHLDPSSKSLLSELLKSSTSMDVVAIKGRRAIKANTIYVCPPQTLLELRKGFIRIAKTNEGVQRGDAATPIDHLFHSLAEDQGDRGVGVILSGGGSDGTLGLKAISDRGGLTFAQDSRSASHESMPRSAATTGQPPVKRGAVTWPSADTPSRRITCDAVIIRIFMSVDRET